MCLGLILHMGVFFVCLFVLVAETHKPKYDGNKFYILQEKTKKGGWGPRWKKTVKEKCSWNQIFILAMEYFRTVLGKSLEFKA